MCILAVRMLLWMDRGNQALRLSALSARCLVISGAGGDQAAFIILAAIKAQPTACGYCTFNNIPPGFVTLRWFCRN